MAKKHPLFDKIKAAVGPILKKVAAEGIKLVSAAANAVLPGSGQFIDAIGESLLKAKDKVQDVAVAAVKEVEKVVGGAHTSSTKGVSFICTAVIDFYGFRQDSFDILGNFRTRVLLQTASGKRDMVKYNRIAPKIVELMKNAEDRDLLFADALSDIHIVKSLLTWQQNARAIDTYKSMVNRLCKKFNLK